MRSSLIGDESAVTGSAGQASASTPPLPEEENRIQDDIRKALISFMEMYALPATTTIDREMTADAFLDEPLAPILAQLSALQAENAALRAEHARRDAADESEAEAVQKMGAEIAALRAERDEALKVLRPVSGFSCSFDGFSFDDAELQFLGRTIGAMTPSLHAAVARVLDPVGALVWRHIQREAEIKQKALSAEYGPSDEMIRAARKSLTETKEGSEHV